MACFLCRIFLFSALLTLWSLGITYAQDITITDKTQIRDEIERELNGKKDKLQNKGNTQATDILNNGDKKLDAKKEQIRQISNVPVANILSESNRRDSLERKLDGVKVKQIYSEKAIDRLCDSLTKKKMDLASYRDMISHLQRSNEDLAKAVSKRFPEFPKTDEYEKKADQLKSLDALKQNGINTSALSLPQAELPTIPKMPDSLLSGLKPLQADQFRSKYLNKIEGLKKINLKEEGLKLKEEKISDLSKKTIFEEKKNFWQKTYFEGVLSMLSDNKNFTIVQASPSFGYHLSRNFSLGLGPNIQLQYENSGVHTIWGARSFAKYEFLDKRLYAQLEDIVSFPNLTYSENQKRKGDTQHSVLVGGGYLVSFAKSAALNFSILYRLTDNKVADSYSSPWVFRIGISSITKNYKSKMLK